MADRGTQGKACGHVLIIADEELFPAVHGGRVETRNEIDALLAAGYEVSLVVCHTHGLTPALRAEHEKLVPRVAFVNRRGFLSSSLTNPMTPHLSAGRLPPGAQMSELCRWAAGLPPVDVVIASHEYTLPLARRLVRQTGAVLVLRSHNDEISYLAGMARHPGTIKRKVYLRTEALRLRLSLRSMTREVDLVALISQADAGVYERVGLRVLVVPPTLSRTHRSPEAVPRFEERKRRLVFVGALNIPHTAQGVLRFARSSMPHVLRALPDAELLVIGRGADDALQRDLSGLPGVRFVGGVDSLDPYLDAARVFVNPVYEGSGVNMKLGPPAAVGLPIVSTTHGARGLAELAIEVADDPAATASACVRLLDDADHWQGSSAALLSSMSRHYALEAIAAQWREALSAAQTE